MVEKEGNGLQKWIKEGQMGVIVLHLLDCLVIGLVAGVIFALLYFYYKNRDKHLPKSPETKPKVAQQLPHQPTLDSDIRLDVLATVPATADTAKISFLDNGENSTQKDTQKDTEKEENPKVEENAKTESQKDSNKKTQTKTQTDPKREPEGQKGEKLSTRSDVVQDDKADVKPKAGAQNSGTENKANQKVTALTANSDESIETLKLESEPKDS